MKYQLDPNYLDGLRERLQNGNEVRLQDTQGEYHVADTEGPQVSFINLATVPHRSDRRNPAGRWRRSHIRSSSLGPRPLLVVKAAEAAPSDLQRPLRWSGN